MRKYLIDIFVPNHSRGLMVDAEVLKLAIGSQNVRVLSVPIGAYRGQISMNDKTLHFEPEADTAIFIELLFEHSKLNHYHKRVYLTNPEWLRTSDESLAHKIITDFIHKTKFSLRTLVKIFPEKKHTFIGFTSIPVPAVVNQFDKFAHFGGKSKTRHTQDIMNIWLSDEKLPMLTIQICDYDLNIPKWIKSDNLRFFIGYLNEVEYKAEFSSHGIHICTSQMEGFGHYINEARSIGALVITLDAPPMNELIDPTCGILIPAEKCFPHNRGIRNISTPNAIKNTILRTLEMPIEIRKNLGLKARERLTKDQSDFIFKLKKTLGIL